MNDRQFLIKILWPLRVVLSYLYRSIVSVRHWKYNCGWGVKKAPCKIISVGNLRVGGSGKTPYVISLVKKLQKEGLKVAILSRGYGGKKRVDQFCVSDGITLLMSSEEAGDEPVMMAQMLPDVPVYVDPNRYNIACLAYREHDIDVCVLDDGFQHRKLFRDTDIVLWDVAHDPMQSRILPWGYLREPLAGIKRADELVLSKANWIEASVLQTYKECFLDLHKNLPIKTSNVLPLQWRELATGSIHNLDILKGRSCVLFHALAQPQSFRLLLGDLGVSICHENTYDDHYVFCKEDLLELERLKTAYEADYLVCSAKDAVKLPDNFDCMVLDIACQMSDLQK